MLSEHRYILHYYYYNNIQLYIEHSLLLLHTVKYVVLVLISYMCLLCCSLPEVCLIYVCAVH
jgi:hypothetical protein